MYYKSNDDKCKKGVPLRKTELDICFKLALGDFVFNAFLWKLKNVTPKQKPSS